MNKTDKLLDSLVHQQAKIDDQEAFTDMVMRRVEAQRQGQGENTYPATIVAPLLRGDDDAANNSQFSIFNSQLRKSVQFSIRIAASVAVVLLVGFFFMLRQPVSVEGSTYCNVHNMDKYRIDLSQIPTGGTPRDMYRRYQEAKREQTFYHNELIKYTHENM